RVIRINHVPGVILHHRRRSRISLRDLERLTRTRRAVVVAITRIDRLIARLTPVHHRRLLPASHRTTTHRHRLTRTHISPGPSQTRIQLIPPLPFRRKRPPPPPPLFPYPPPFRSRVIRINHVPGVILHHRRRSRISLRDLERLTRTRRAVVVAITR